MKVFAIADLHLPGGDTKPMDVFGSHWANHFDKICSDWRARVTAEDIVLLPGDLSWAMRFESAQDDLQAIGALPGRKVILRGNHDYWWSSISRVRSVLPEGMYALQNDALRFGSLIICGTRGWVCPGAPAFDEGDRKIYERELARLSLSLGAATKEADCIREEGGTPRIIAMLHYPPFGDRSQLPSEPSQLLSAAGVTDVVYGHLHGPGIAAAFNGELDGVRYQLTSCDSLDFTLYKIPGEA